MIFMSGRRDGAIFRDAWIDEYVTLECEVMRVRLFIYLFIYYKIVH